MREIVIKNRFGGGVHNLHAPFYAGEIGKILDTLGPVERPHAERPQGLPRRSTSCERQ